ncbi:MAG: hypothetical protein E7635_03355 [Ruminococcaceae bacterium]|nr:hypothetical protein [Oscillospiraceae bacterium]
MLNVIKLCKKTAEVLEFVIGVAIMVCLFIGGLGFVGYVIAFCIGGELATTICTWLYTVFYGYLIKLSTITTLFTFLLIYLKGEAKWVNPVRCRKNKYKS